MSDILHTSSRQEFVTLTNIEMNRVFALDNLRQRLFNRKQEIEQQDWEAMRQQFLSATSSERAELLFINRLIADYGSSLPRIKYLFESTPKELLEEELINTRSELIARMGGFEIGKHWIRCMKSSDNDDMWVYTARKIWGRQGSISAEEVDRFFTMLDEIAILTDILNGQGATYGIDFKPQKSVARKLMARYSISLKAVDEILNAINKYMMGKNQPKSLVMPARAAVEGGAITRPVHSDFIEMFPLAKDVAKSSYNDYMNPMNTPYDDAVFEQMKKDFENIADRFSV